VKLVFGLKMERVGSGFKVLERGDSFLKVLERELFLCLIIKINRFENHF
jgi:hypothetical protein